mmetsp:Transcript_12478/g.31428  ORF Transcript_12478/g.31428 Transcript_12478/m.31428 type:complete len:131 (-) Transcript_12478:1702-2094(-)
MGRVGNLRRRKAPARSEGGDGEAEGDCSGSGGAGIGTSYGHHGHGHHDFPLHGDDTKGISQVEEVEDDDDDDAEADIFGGIGQYFSWTFSIVSGLCGVAVLCNLPAVAALLDGLPVQLKVGDTVWFEFNA